MSGVSTDFMLGWALNELAHKDQAITATLGVIMTKLDDLKAAQQETRNAVMQAITDEQAQVAAKLDELVTRAREGASADELQTLVDEENARRAEFVSAIGNVFNETAPTTEPAPTEPPTGETGPTEL